MWNCRNRQLCLGSKKVYVALCGLKRINLMNETLRILGYHFTDNKTLQQENNFKKHTIKIVNVLKVWRIRHVILDGKTNVFKSLAISKVIHVLHVTPIFTDIINLLNTIQKSFQWKHSQKKQKGSLKTRVELLVLRTDVEDQAILEHFVLYWGSKCKQTKEQGSKDCLWTHIFTFFKDYCQLFFLFLSRCKQNKIKLCCSRLQFVKETQTNTV